MKECNIDRIMMNLDNIYSQQSIIRLVLFLLLSIFVLTNSKYLGVVAGVFCVVAVMLTYISMRRHLSNTQEEAQPNGFGRVGYALWKSKYNLIFLLGLVCIFIVAATS